MQSVTFQATPEDLVAAYRLNYALTVKSKRVLRGYLIGGLLVAVAAGGAAWKWDLASVPLAMLGGFAYWVLVLSLIILAAYLRLPRQVRRIYRQQKSLHDEATVEWSDSGIDFVSARGRAHFVWSDFIGIFANRDVIVLRQSEALINFIPTRVLSPDQRNALTSKV
ncbi:YcxB family protein [Sphingomonas sp. ASY06-1R]|uniref:YcxB family protein n=1 Tax=Sphingomonas sp. ASY06-1R TaxID=3445771 RepID=UPI003FA2DEE8